MSVLMRPTARLIALAICAAACHAATYYVDSAHGADTNSGMEEFAPWKTLQKVNISRFQPSDRILLKSGSIWQGQLTPASSGGDGAPLVLDRCRKGPRPRIDRAGLVEDTVSPSGPGTR